MAVNVVITPGGLFKKQYTLQDLLMQGMSFGIMDEAFRLEENQVTDVTVLYNPKHICRGMEISFEGKKIVLRLPLPNDESDIRYFYNFIKHVCEICHTRKFERDEEIVSVEDVENCILADMAASQSALKQIISSVSNEEEKTFILFGVMNPIVIGPAEINAIESDLHKFGEFMNSRQQMDVFYMAPIICKEKDERIIGVYPVSPGIAYVVALEPSLLTNEIKVSAWYAYLAISESESVKVNYNDFVEFIDKSQRYDGNHVIINIPGKELRDFACAHRVDK